MTELAKQEPAAAFPVEVNTTLETFERLKPKWLRYRAAGSFDMNGNFVPALSFLESEQMPKIEMDTFHELDDLLAIARRMKNKERK